MQHGFLEEEKRGVYRAIAERRDVRSQFLPAPIPDAVLARLLWAAHCAPSVGLMQPWEFIVIRDAVVKQRVGDLFERANRKAAGVYEGEQRALYDSLKLAGILEAPINLCVTCHPTVSRGFGLGRQTMPETAHYSSVCAVQNLCLAARAEGVGVGWVSILDPVELRQALAIPPRVDPVAYLCLGYVNEFLSRPELEIKGWEQLVPLAELIHFDSYGGRDSDCAVRLAGSAVAENKE
ncbi:MAG TPA: 5,6-dimethylbenzimidazole synthase [Blastocatellia bacterium]|nr:5,6-dimethylbenzimidazole synthase [Blastocatellia bacterium]